MIGIATITANESGDLVLYELPDSNLKSQNARVSRTATLDGGVVITHSGFSHGDRTFQVKAKPDESELATLEAIHQTETFIHLACREGFFSGAIDRMLFDGSILDLFFLVKERLDSR